MRKLLVLGVLLLLPLFASAREAETLLTPDGTLFALESRAGADGVTLHLVLSTRTGDQIHSQVVPASRAEGSHTDAAMAYEPQSKTLFVFWIRELGMLNSQMMVTSLNANGEWSDPITFGQPFDYRENLRIAVTRKVTGASNKLEAGLSIHAAWWETDTQTGIESARYAVLGVENGEISEPVFLDLEEAMAKENTQHISNGLDDPSVLRNPVLTPSSRQDSVLVTFGNLATGRLNRLRVFPTIPPVANGRIRIPVGRAEGSIPPPRFNVAANSTMLSVQGDNDSLALYIREDSKLRYVLYRDGKWSDTRTIALDEQISASTAIEAIRRLVHEN